MSQLKGKQLQDDTVNQPKIDWGEGAGQITSDEVPVHSDANSPIGYTPGTANNTADGDTSVTDHLLGIDDILDTILFDSTPTRSNKLMTPLNTSSDGDQATLTTFATTPTGDSHVWLVINGVEYEPAANEAARATSAWYASSDGGTTAKDLEDYAAGDTIHWNGSIHNFEIATDDNLSLDYDAI